MTNNLNPLIVLRLAIVFEIEWDNISIDKSLTYR